MTDKWEVLKARLPNVVVPSSSNFIFQNLQWLYGDNTESYYNTPKYLNNSILGNHALLERKPLGGPSAAPYTTQEISYKTPVPPNPNSYHAQLSVLFVSCGFWRPNE